MTHAPAALAPSRRPARPAARAVRRDEALRPARGIMLGLGLSSLAWAGLAALIAF